MNMITLTAFDLMLSSVLILVLALLSWRMRMGLERDLIVAAVRTVVQLLLVGLVLKILFEQIRLGWIIAIAFVMLMVAGREALARQKRAFSGWWGYGLSSLSMFISSFALALVALVIVIGPQPWYSPQYAIPLLGMLLGNTMTGIALGLDRLTSNAWQQRPVIEARLLLGQNWSTAIGDIRHESMRAGMIPMINAMAVAGIVSLPGMMTGQILAGSPPVEAVKYQILIMFLITAGTGFGTITAVWLGSRRLFDERQRLRLDRLNHARK